MSSTFLNIEISLDVVRWLGVLTLLKVSVFREIMVSLNLLCVRLMSDYSVILSAGKCLGDERCSLISRFGVLI